MKKKLGYFAIIIGIFVLPFVVNAQEKYKTQNLKEILTDEGIEEAYPDYKETANQVKIYLFRGSGCQYCRAFLNYLNSITEEYGKYFKVVGYEVWNDDNNAKLMESVGEFLEQDARGVPYIVIGQNVFTGYTESYNDAIISAIMEEYNKEDKYDVFNEMDKAEREERIREFVSNVLPIICNFVFVVVGVIVVVVYTNNRFNKLEKMIGMSHSYKESKEQKDSFKIETFDETKRQTKKTTKKK